MSDEELAWLATQARHATTIVEVGSAWGRSTRALADHTDGVVYAVDRWANTERWEGFQKYHADHLTSGRVQAIRMESTQAASILDLSADLVFIDASHAYENVVADLDAWAPKVKPGGVLCGHDFWEVAHPGVRRAVTERFGDRVTRHADSIWAVRA